MLSLAFKYRKFERFGILNKEFMNLYKMGMYDGQENLGIWAFSKKNGNIIMSEIQRSLRIRHINWIWENRMLKRMAMGGNKNDDQYGPKRRGRLWKLTRDYKRHWKDIYEKLERHIYVENKWRTYRWGSPLQPQRFGMIQLSTMRLVTKGKIFPHFYHAEHLNYNIFMKKKHYKSQVITFCWFTVNTIRHATI